MFRVANPLSMGPRRSTARGRAFALARAAIVALGLGVTGNWPVQAQEAAVANPAAAATAGASTPTVLRHPEAVLPPDSRTRHQVTVGERTLQFTATAGAIPLRGTRGQLLAEIAYVAYTRDGAAAATRPVAFAFNGGPGSASTWLHIGAMGPWRVPLTTAVAREAGTPELTANAETWLDFTDLVFIDPAGTGYSRIARDTPPPPPGEARRGEVPGMGRLAASRDDGGQRYFWSVGGDVESLTDVIKSWLDTNGRQASAKLVVGESYGGFRAPRIAHRLAKDHGIATDLLVLISPVLDFDGRRGGQLPMHYVHLLPSLAATRLEHQGVTPSRAALAEAEDYARGELWSDLTRGPRDAAAVDRITARVSRLSGLPVDAVRRRQGRVHASAFLAEIRGGGRQVTSIYDAGMTDFEPAGAAPGSRFVDPFTSGLTGPMTRAMVGLYQRLGWPVQGDYAMLSSEVNRGWVWNNSPGPPDSLWALAELLEANAALRVLVTHGFTDLVTPYFASKLQLDQLPIHGDAARVSLVVYPGGHMHYSRDASRTALRGEVERNLGEALRSARLGGPRPEPKAVSVH